MRVPMLCLLALGCGEVVKGTVVSTDSVGACPDARPLQESDLDCICGISSTIVDTLLEEDCAELWCHPDVPELECVFYDSTSTSSSSSSSSSSSGGSGGFGGSGT